MSILVSNAPLFTSQFMSCNSSSVSKDPHAEHVALPLAPVGALCHEIRPSAPDAVRAAVIPAKAGIQGSLILDPGFRRGDDVSEDSLPRL